MIYIDAKTAIRNASNAHRELKGSRRARAIASALNVVARKARVEASKDIRGTYKMRAKDIRKSQSVRKATAKGGSEPTISAAMITVGRPLPIMAFRPTKIKDGISVNIMGRRKRFPGAFIATMKSGHTGVFVKGRYTSGKLVGRRRRLVSSGDDLPITEVKTTAIPTALSNPKVISVLQRKVAEELPKELKRSFAYFLSRPT